LAVKLLTESSATQDKIAKAFRLIVCRKATAEETKILNDYYADQLHSFSQDKQSAAKLLVAGEHPLNEKVDKVSAAAMMQLITTIYNLEETITKS
jgi:hypothetical protein